jgi:hypothetical protein
MKIRATSSSPVAGERGKNSNAASTISSSESCLSRRHLRREWQVRQGAVVGTVTMTYDGARYVSKLIIRNTE